MEFVNTQSIASSKQIVIALNNSVKIAAALEGVQRVPYSLIYKNPFYD